MLRRLFAHPYSYALVVAAFWAFNIYLFYPGQMTHDPTDQLFQARTGYFTDHHPPVMAFIWRLLNHISDGPQSMLVLHVTLFWAGIGLLGNALQHRHLLLSYLLPLAWLMPPVMTSTAPIWKDTGMMVGLSFATMLCLRWLYLQTRPTWPGIIALTTAMLYAVSVRHNAFTALPPLCVLIMLAIGERRHIIVKSLALFITLVAASYIVNASLTRQHTHISQHLFLYDLMGMSKYADTPLYPPYVYEDTHTRDYNGFKKRFPYRVWATPFASPIRSKPQSPPATLDPEKLVELKQAWLDAITQHPGAYFAYRWECTRCLLRLAPDYQGSHFAFKWQEPKISPIRMAFWKYAERHRQSILFKGKFWSVFAFLPLGIATFLLLRGRRHAWPSALLAISGLMVPPPLIFTMLGCDFRYLYWLMMSGLLACIALVLPPAKE